MKGRRPKLRRRGLKLGERRRSKLTREKAETRVRKSRSKLRRRGSKLEKKEGRRAETRRGEKERMILGLEEAALRDRR